MIQKRQPWKWASMKKKRAVLGLTVLAAVSALVWWIGSNRWNAGSSTVTATETTKEIVQEELPVSKREEVLLSRLYKTMIDSSYAETARILNQNEEMLAKLLTETLNGEKYCYREIEYEDGTTIRNLEPLGKNEAMEGLVLTRYNTVFYGSFVNEKPEGVCHAIQAMILDKPRYTFAEGIWKNGKMNGEGRTGYHYYLDAPGSGFVMTDKAGTYKDNLLDGKFIYQTENRLGEKLSWEMEADMGVTVLNDRWTYFSLRKEYVLRAREDLARTYVISEEKAGALIWNNLITWDE